MEGTRHRRDKGLDRKRPMLLRRVSTTAVPAKEGLQEVIGAHPFRAQAKRREAAPAGKLSSDSDRPKSVRSREAVVATGR